MVSAQQEGQASNDGVKPRVNYRVKITKSETTGQDWMYTTRVIGIYNEYYYGITVRIRDNQKYSTRSPHSGTPPYFAPDVSEPLCPDSRIHVTS